VRESGVPHIQLTLGWRAAELDDQISVGSIFRKRPVTEVYHQNIGVDRFVDAPGLRLRWHCSSHLYKMRDERQQLEFKYDVILYNLPFSNKCRGKMKVRILPIDQRHFEPGERELH